MGFRGREMSLVEFIVLFGLMTSILAMGTDVMLPALPDIGRDLGVRDPNGPQLVITAFFLGFAGGQILVGPLSDRFGRRPVIFAGSALFVAASFLSMTTSDWTIMLAARFLQGLGGAAPRVVAVAIVRDRFEGRAMAQVMSAIMAVFILTPVVAPALGQLLIAIGGWRACFAALVVLAAVTMLWFGLRQPESLAVGDRQPLTRGNLARGIGRIVASRQAVGYTLAAGFAFGPMIGYLSSAQQVFQVAYDTGALFVVYFGVSALSIGLASLVNARLVMRYGMRRLTAVALGAMTMLGLALSLVVVLTGGQPGLPLFMGWLLASFFCLGTLFGNLNALAMEPLGAIAGLGAAFVGSVSTFVGLGFGLVIGQGFDGSAAPVIFGFALGGCAAIVIMTLTERSMVRAGQPLR